MGKPKKEEEREDFAQLADGEQPGFFAEFWLFLRTNKKWWLTPILIVLLLLAVLTLIGNSPLAPFFYPFM